MNNSQSALAQDAPNPAFQNMFNVWVMFLVVLACGLAMSPSITDPDLWGHVQFGRDTIDRGWVSATTTYSFTATDYPWINHENLSEVALAATVDQFGPVGLLLGKFLLSLFVVGAVIWSNFRQQVGIVATSIVALLVAANLGYHWSFRPQLSSFFFFTLMVLVLQFCFSRWQNQWHLKFFQREGTAIEQSWMQGRMLWLLVPIMMIWTNSHGGFVAGVCILVAYFGLRAFEAWQAGAQQNAGLMRRMGLLAVAVVAATLINPYSYKLPLWLLNSLSVPRPEIVDWSNGQLWSLVGFKFLFLVAVASFAILFSKKQRDFVHLCLLLITLWQAFSHFRHVPFFTILCGFWLGPHLQSALDRFQSSQEDSVPFFASPMRRMATCAVVLIAITAVSFQLSNRLYRIQVDRSVYPVDAFAYMHEQDINGRVVVTYNWAQYAIAALCEENGVSPSSKVAFDGRYRTCYPQQVIDMHFDFLYGEQDQIIRYRSPDSPPSVDPGRVLEYGEPDIAIIKRFDEVTSAYMQTRDDWGLLYQDGLAEVWGKRSRFDDPDSGNYVPQEKRIRTEAMPTGIVSWPAIPKQNTNPSTGAVPSNVSNQKLGNNYVSNR